MVDIKKRRSFESGHARKFLLIVDDSQEVESALYYAASRIAHSSGTLVMLYVIEPQEHQPWAGVRQVPSRVFYLIEREDSIAIR